LHVKTQLLMRRKAGQAMDLGGNETAPRTPSVMLE
jgi:hypothetical protein